MISSPYVFPVSVDIDRNIFSELYVYGSGSLEGWMDTVVTVMNPWAGYIIYNHDDNNVRGVLEFNKLVHAFYEK